LRCCVVARSGTAWSNLSLPVARLGHRSFTGLGAPTSARRFSTPPPPRHDGLAGETLSAHSFRVVTTVGPLWNSGLPFNRGIATVASQPRGDSVQETWRGRGAGGAIACDQGGPRQETRSARWSAAARLRSWLDLARPGARGSCRARPEPQASAPDPLTNPAKPTIIPVTIEKVAVRWTPPTLSACTRRVRRCRVQAEALRPAGLTGQSGVVIGLVHRFFVVPGRKQSR
jgi:hypothetical protein